MTTNEIFFFLCIETMLFGIGNRLPLSDFHLDVSHLLHLPHQDGYGIQVISANDVKG